MTPGQRGMSPNHIQEQLSLAYVRAAIFRYGYNLSRLEVDDHGIDGTIVAYSRNRHLGNRNKIDFQLKATTVYDIRGANLIYDLPVDNYNVLIETGPPQVLILFAMPGDDALWLSQSHDEMSLRKCAYWVSLMGLARSGNSSTVRVSIPMSNMLDQDGLLDMFRQLI